MLKMLKISLKYDDDWFLWNRFEAKCSICVTICSGRNWPRTDKVLQFCIKSLKLQHYNSILGIVTIGAGAMPATISDNVVYQSDKVVSRHYLSISRQISVYQSLDDKLSPLPNDLCVAGAARQKYSYSWSGVMAIDWGLVLRSTSLY